MKETVEGVEIHRVRYLQLGRKNKLSRLINYVSFLFSIILHFLKFGSYRAVVVYSNPPILLFAATLANWVFGTKLIFVAYDVYPEVAYADGSISPGSVMDSLMKWINRMFYKRATAVVALTEEMRDFLCSHRSVAPEKVYVIANWAHEERADLRPDSFARFGYSEGDFIVSYFGNMGICQDMETLLDCAEILKAKDGIRFLLAGHGSKMQAVRQRIQSCGLHNVQLHEFLVGDDFEQAMAVSSCCVVSLEEGLMGLCAPSKFYSYLQGGKAVLTVAEDGSYLRRETEAEDIGRSCAVGDAQALAMAVRELYADRELCAAMGRRAEELYRSRYAQPLAMARYETLLKTVLSEEV